MSSLRWLRRTLWIVGLPTLAVFFVRAFVGDVYYVDSGSMEPVIHGAPTGGDSVFVLYDDEPHPARFDLVVLQRSGSREPLVKRVVALPGETVQIVLGDLFINQARLAPAAVRPAPVPMFDSALHDLLDAFQVDLRHQNRLMRTATGWRLDARGAQRVLVASRSRVFDDYLAPDGSRVEGKMYANDLACELELRLEEPWKSFELILTEEQDRFTLELEPAGPGRAKLTLRCMSPSGETREVYASVETEFSAAQFHRLRLSNIDNVLDVALDEQEHLLHHVYAENTSQRRYEGAVLHALPRVVFGGDDLVADVRAVRLWRDRVYSERGTRATVKPLTLAPNEVFVLGDNSGESNDSRDWGPVHLKEIVGHPVAVVWPPSRWRWLR